MNRPPIGGGSIEASACCASVAEQRPPFPN
nr:MAG TPA: hypothetical protein [Caudoviricetes sp.]DAW10303.1 MAG TPA: hypothetical protein [Caudoviricetes sp.]